MEKVKSQKESVSETVKDADYYTFTDKFLKTKIDKFHNSYRFLTGTPSQIYKEVYNREDEQDVFNMGASLINEVTNVKSSGAVGNTSAIAGKIKYQAYVDVTISKCLNTDLYGCDWKYKLLQYFRKHKWMPI